MAKVAKKTTRTRRRDRKNIEKGAAHIRSTFNNTIVQSLIQPEMQFHGQVQVVLASEVQERALRLLHRQLQKQLRKLQKSMA